MEEEFCDYILESLKGLVRDSTVRAILLIDVFHSCGFSGAWLAADPKKTFTGAKPKAQMYFTFFKQPIERRVISRFYLTETVACLFRVDSFENMFD
jgi:hypothetical protein